jgi:LEA14-like dessication related protein
MWLNSLLLLALLSLSACQFFGPKKVIEPKVDIEQVQVQGFNFEKTNLVFFLNVKNENSFDIKIDEFDYKFFIFRNEEKELVSEGKMRDLPEIKKTAQTKVAVPLEVKTQKIVSSVLDMLSLGEISYEIQGTV